MSKKVQKAIVDLSDSDSDSEVPVVKKTTKKAEPNKRKASAASEASSNKVTKAKKEEKKPKKQLQESSDEDEDLLKKTKKTSKKSPKKQSKKADDSDDSSEEVVKPKKTAPAKSKKKEDSDSESESEKPKKKAPKKKEADSDDEEPVSKRKASKASSKKKPADDSDDEIEVVKKDNKAKEEVEDEEDDGQTHSEIFVKNLPWSVDQNSLAEGFGEYGTVTNVKILTNKQTGKPSGLAFVAFENRSQAKKAIANVTMIGDRQVTCSFSNENRPSNDGPRQERGPREQFTGTAYTVFVGNLGFKTNENSIRKFFAKAGNVVGIRIAKNEDGRAKGFCHVDFDTEEGATKAVALAGQPLDGRELRVDKSEPRKGGQGAGRGQGGPRQGGFSRPGSNPSKPKHGVMGAGGNKKTFADSDDDE